MLSHAPTRACVRRVGGPVLRARGDGSVDGARGRDQDYVRGPSVRALLPLLVLIPMLLLLLLLLLLRLLRLLLLPRRCLVLLWRWRL